MHPRNTRCLFKCPYLLGNLMKVLEELVSLSHGLWTLSPGMLTLYDSTLYKGQVYTVYLCRLAWYRVALLVNLLGFALYILKIKTFFMRNNILRTFSL